MAYKRIETVEQLKADCTDKQEDYFIWFGGARSSKTIQYSSKEDIFYIFNSIDNSEQEVKPQDLDLHTSIITAMRKGTFYKDKF